MDPSASGTSGLNGPNGRQKRVLPSRPRRGGPGIGTCDIDLMILEHQKRGAETEAIIPNDMLFLLTTNSGLFSGSGPTAELTVTTVPSERYFDRPDVLKAYREQRVIQTPSFTNVQDNPSVGRFRPRGPEDAQIDTSDAAYERRHRKYETFERRQRLREKEKLKHEQYKLKERIEQLRIMDASAFLALPASNFSPAPGVSEEGSEDDLANLAGAHVNGGVAYNEGERRRKEMLDIALSLEERYRVLLPPERLRKLQTQPSITRENATPGPPQTHTPGPPSRRVDTLEPEREIFIDDSYFQRQDKIRIKLKWGGKGSASQSPAPPGTSRTSKRSARMSNPPQPMQKSSTRRRSRAEPSRSPTPPMSPRGFAAASQFTTYTSSEPASPVIQALRTLEGQDLGEIPPFPDGRRSSVSSERKFEVDLAAAITRPQTPVSNPEAPTPPKKRSPPPNTRLAPAPEINLLPLQQETSLAESTEPPGSPSPEETRPQGSPIRAGKGFPPTSLPAPPPPPIETLPNATPLPRVMEVEHVPTDLPSRHPRRMEDGSRLLELANAVHSITATSPPPKRQKTWHYYSPPKPLVPSESAPASPPKTDQADQPPVPEREPTLTAPVTEPVSSSVTTSALLLPIGEPWVVSNLPRRSPSVPMAVSVSASESVPPSTASPSASIPRLMTTLSTPDIISSAFAGFGPSTGPRRRGPQNRSKEVEYKSTDTGELRRTQSLLLIAGIRGSLRQTQRHQMAFGVKVPEEISDPYDFWLPDEFLPEEELRKYRNYDGTGSGDGGGNGVVMLNGSGDGDSALPMGQ